VQDELAAVVERTLKRGGKVVVPAFAVGRTQELVYHLHQLMEHGEIPSVPVFVDSPLAVEASEIFTQHPEYFDDELRDFLREEKNRVALGFDRLTYIESARASRALNDRDEPMIIIATSGMADSGRVIHHLKRTLADPKNTVLIVSYQAPHTLGRALVDGVDHVTILGDRIPVRAEIATLAGLSAHAGQNFLLEYALALKGEARQVFLVHGEEGPAEALQAKLKAAGFARVYYPYLRQSFTIGAQKAESATHK
jgi:metallo-beta-lactamase family protein